MISKYTGFEGKKLGCSIRDRGFQLEQLDSRASAFSPRVELRAPVERAHGLTPQAGSAGLRHALQLVHQGGGTRDLVGGGRDSPF